MFATLFLHIINFYATNVTIENDPAWSEMIASKCDGKTLDNYEKSQMNRLGKDAITFGSYFGILFIVRVWPRIHKSVLINEAIWKSIARLLIFGLINLPFSLMFTFLGKHISNSFVHMIFNALLPSFIMGFIMFGIQDRVNMVLMLL